MLTESGREEFIVMVKGGVVHTMMRDDGQSYYTFWVWGETEFGKMGFKLVKVYRDDDENYPITAADCEIGYHEQRLTALERLAVLCWVGRYWDIPF